MMTPFRVNRSLPHGMFYLAPLGAHSGTQTTILPLPQKAETTHRKENADADPQSASIEAAFAHNAVNSAFRVR
eukprot:61952-Rhodomonas_salina.1